MVGLVCDCDRLGQTKKDTNAVSCVDIALVLTGGPWQSAQV